MMIHPAIEGPASLQVKLVELSEIVLPEEERMALVNHLRSEAMVAEQTRYDIKGPENLIEFFYRWRKVGDIDLVEIKYYYN